MLVDLLAVTPACLKKIFSMRAQHSWKTEETIRGWWYKQRPTHQAASQAQPTHAAPPSRGAGGGSKGTDDLGGVGACKALWLSSVLERRAVVPCGTGEKGTIRPWPQSLGDHLTGWAWPGLISARPKKDPSVYRSDNTPKEFWESL